ncbi:hypothetical protein ACFQJ7_09535 [Halovenus rubra]|uniref:Uncharacterized protein n=2 Tax=Halovenus rubra TaxID=869890 RepID=A0ACC7DX42_9EURY|nr:hypothetical protein [Halovenus rubra]
MLRQQRDGTPVGSSQRSLERRTLLAVGATTLLTSITGCTRISEFVADYVVGDVNLFNLSEDRLTGSLEFIGPNGEELLAESLDLDPDADVEKRKPTVIYEDVLNSTGPHRINLETDGPSDRANISVSDILRVTDPGEEKVVVFFGNKVGNEFLTLSLIEDFAELEDDLES